MFFNGYELPVSKASNVGKRKYLSFTSFTAIFINVVQNEVESSKELLP